MGVRLLLFSGEFPGGTFPAEWAVVDRIMMRLKPTFVAEKLSPCLAFEPVALIAAVSACAHRWPH
jgi:hypothetical protein